MKRSRRLALRQRRQEISHAGGHIPAELMGDLRSHEKDDELDEIDIELELEMMYGQLEKVLDMVKDSPDSEPFLRPVSADVAPDYADIITKPMDLQTMESKLLEREYRNKFDFIEDMNNLLLNCLTYNGIDS
uniref:Bromo domain-containing protein n=1 Tax=Plectus sambesii TaxID=2011161 RepID=A0A914VDY2_9BILA